MTFEGDWLGVAPCYHADCEDGVLISSRLIDLLAIEPGLAKPPDRLGLIEFVLFRNPLGGRTLHQAVRRTESGHVLSYDRASGFSIATRPRLALGGETVCTPEEAVDSTIALLTGSLRTLASRRPKRLALALSGGFDSRLLAAVCQAAGLPFTAYTYGVDWQREVKIANRTARALGIQTVPLGYPETTILDDLPLYLRVVEGQADYSAVQIANLLRIEDKPRQVLLHGFLGDSIAGSHYLKLPPEAYRSRSDLARAIVLRAAGSDLVAACRLLHVSVSIDELLDEVERGLDPALPTFRAFRMWDLQNRQRRYIGAQVRLLGATLETAAPFYDRAYAGFYLSLGQPLIHNRHLTKLTFRSRFPRLAAIPRSDDDLPLLPGFMDRIAGWTRATGRRVFGMYPLDRLAWRMRAMRGPDFWDRASGNRLRPAFLDGADRTLPALADVLGIAVDAKELRDVRPSTLLLRTVFALGAYARFASE